MSQAALAAGSMRCGSRLVDEEALAKLIIDAKIDRKEGMAYADSPTNLMWRLQNDFSLAANAAKAQKEARDAPDDTPSFTEIVLDVKASS